jgi:hypothetical protein
MLRRICFNPSVSDQDPNRSKEVRKGREGEREREV